MAEQSFKRKLTAILSADVAGYSRLMGSDEAATVKILETYRVIRIKRTDMIQHRFTTETPDFHLTQCRQEIVLEPLVLFASYVCTLRIGL